MTVFSVSSPGSPPANPYQVHAIAPLLVAPNTAVQQEMASVLSTMQAVVQQQLELSAQGLADFQEAASELTWSQHYEQLLWDMQTILDSTAAKPGCLPAEVAAGVLTGVLEFLGHHGCWCSISWLLAEAIRSKLLNHAKAAAAQRLQEPQPCAGEAASDATGAMCAGFVMALAASPGPVRPSNPSSSTSPVAVSRSRRVLSALSAAIAGKHISTSGAGAGSSYQSPTSTELNSAGSSTAVLHQQPGLLVRNPSSSASSSSKLSRGRFQSFRSVSAGGPAVSHPERSAVQHAAVWRSSSCQAWNVVLVVTAASLVLLLLVLNCQQLVPCQAAAGEQSIGQAEGCVLTHEHVLASGIAGAPTAVMCFVFKIMLYAPFMALLVLAVSIASKVCLVL